MNNLINFIINNWYVIIGLLALVVVVGFICYKFLGLPTSEQLKKVKEWLIYATMQTEREFGSKTGQLKLRAVYDMFVVRFNWLARVITFEQFSKLVDEALVEVRHLLETNNAIKEIVNNK